MKVDIEEPHAGLLKSLAEKLGISPSAIMNEALGAYFVGYTAGFQAGIKTREVQTAIDQFCAAAKPKPYFN